MRNVSQQSALMQPRPTLGKDPKTARLKDTGGDIVQRLDLSIIAGFSAKLYVRIEYPAFFFKI